jgi:hypothetical protein
MVDVHDALPRLKAALARIRKGVLQLRPLEGTPR